MSGIVQVNPSTSLGCRPFHNHAGGDCSSSSSGNAASDSFARALQSTPVSDVGIVSPSVKRCAVIAATADRHAASFLSRSTCPRKAHNTFTVETRPRIANSLSCLAKILCTRSADNSEANGNPGDNKNGAATR